MKSIDVTPFSPDSCLAVIPNRFDMTLAAAARARELSLGATSTVVSSNKECVTALREIAAGTVERNILQNTIAKGRGHSGPSAAAKPVTGGSNGSGT